MKIEEIRIYVENVGYFCIHEDELLYEGGVCSLYSIKYDQLFADIPRSYDTIIIVSKFDISIFSYTDFLRIIELIKHNIRAFD